MKFEVGDYVTVNQKRLAKTLGFQNANILMRQWGTEPRKITSVRDGSYTIEGFEGRWTGYAFIKQAPKCCLPEDLFVL